MNDRDNNADNIFFKTIRCNTFSEPRAQAEVNDGSEYNMGDKNVKDDKGGNKGAKINKKCTYAPSISTSYLFKAYCC